jgi:hypothetical protein
MAFKNIINKSITTLLLASTMLTGCVSVESRYVDVLAFTEEGGVKAVEEVNKTDNTDIIDTIYKFAINDRDMSQELIDFHINFWEEIIKSKDFQEKQAQWGSLEMEDKINYLQDLTSKFCEYAPELEKNGFSKGLTTIHENSRRVGSFNVDNKDIEINNLFLNNLDEAQIDRFSQSWEVQPERIKEIFSLVTNISNLAHELCHATQLLKILPGFEESNQNKLITENLKYYAEGDAYPFQPAEIVEQLLGEMVSGLINGDRMIPPEHLYGEDISSIAGNSSSLKHIKDKFLENPKIMEQLTDNNRLNRREIKEYLPAKNKLNGVLFLPADAIAQKIIEEGNLTCKDFSGSSIIGLKAENKNFSGSNFDGTELLACELDKCDFSGIDLSQIKDCSKSSIWECKITSTPENIKFVEAQKKINISSFHKTNWVNEQGEEIALRKAPITQQEDEIVKKRIVKAIPDSQSDAAKKLSQQLQNIEAEAKTSHKQIKKTSLTKGGSF